MCCDGFLSMWMVERSQMAVVWAVALHVAGRPESEVSPGRNTQSEPLIQRFENESSFISQPYNTISGMVGFVGHIFNP